MIAYPPFCDLPPWDPARGLIEDPKSLLAFFPDCNVLAIEKDSIWWAKKELKQDKFLSDFIGKNEKTTIIVKPNKKGQGAPVSEPPVDQETQKKMMAYYYKKQEEQKKLEENQDEDYLDRQWADSNRLKNEMITGGRPLRFK